LRLHLLGETLIAPAGDSLRPVFSTGVERKKPALAALYSLVLPGMGEAYADGFSSGKYFLIAEGVLWLTYFTMDVHAHALQDDARSYSAVHAGVSLAGKNDQFFVDVGNFSTVDDYNDKRLRDREPEKLYNAAAGYDWQWETEADRLTYRDGRIAADTWTNNRKFVLAAVLVNHVASAINAARAAISYNKGIDDPLGDISISAHVLGSLSRPHGLAITLSKPF
jgi:hypothetical protein